MWIYFLIILFGLAWGSFLNVVIYRIDNLRSIFRQRSRCPECKNTIRWYDNIPLLSFVVLRGKCRDCGKSISWQYPIVELFTAVIFVLLYLKLDISWLDLIAIFYFSVLIVLAIYDLKTMLIVSEFAYGAIALAVIYWAILFLTKETALTFSVAGFVILGGLLMAGIPAILVIGSREKWMGSGDIVIGLACGLMLGFKLSLTALALAFIIGAAFGLVLVAMRLKHFKDRVAFGPFLILGTLIAFFWGEHLINWYLGTFL